ncbi:MAG TPA: hypothetical protein VIV60_08535 [Polyangiaceae bacterium]
MTVALPVHQQGARGWSLALCWIGLACLLCTSGLVASRLRLWSAVSAALFCTASTCVWLLLGTIEVNLGILGTLGWATFAVGWVRAAETRPLRLESTALRVSMQPRHRLPWSSWMVLGLGLVGALCALTLAWTTEGSRERQLLTHAIAVLGALWLLTAASTGAASLGRQAAERAATASQFRRAAVLFTLMGLGIWLSFVRK